jgi:hypothetical protein
MIDLVEGPRSPYRRYHAAGRSQPRLAVWVFEHAWRLHSDESSGWLLDPPL